MRFRDKNQDRRAFFGDGLYDPKEQEQEKMAHEEGNALEKKPPTIDPPNRDEPKEEILRPCPMECPPPKLPEQAGERRLTCAEAERRPPRKEKGKRECRSARFGGYLVMSASLLVAFLVMIGVLCFLPSPTPIDEESLAVTEADDAPAQKVVYVDRYGDSEGAISTAELYARCMDSVVSISTANEKTVGIGSGFVLREDGYIATAHHVVAGMTEIEVITANGVRYDAQMVGGDAMTDLALLKIDASGLSPVTIGSSSSLLVGERVVAIGTPASLDYAGSLSSGEVSFALRAVKIYGEGGRTLEKKMRLIQTNALVNPGNSGCPLFDCRGEVVGMITMKLGNQFDGMGFAVPIDGAKEILEAMRTGTPLTDALLSAVSVRAAGLGVEVEACTLGDSRGVRVTGLLQTENAVQALSVGDLILAINDRAVTKSADMEAALSDCDPGQTVVLTILRGGQKLTLDVVLGVANRDAVK